MRKSNNKPYMEPHHLIPMAYQDNFDFSLDIEENIVCLCSNCHNKIHYGQGNVELAIKLFNERKEALEKCGIIISEENL